MSKLEIEKPDNHDVGADASVLSEVLLALRGLRFGSVVLTIHESRVVEIHRTEKVRRTGLKGL